MDVRRTKRRLRRLLRRALAVGLIAAPSAFVVLWLVVQHRPRWYRPAAVTETLVQRAQAETAAVVDSASHQMVHGAAFEVALTDREVNEWLACLPRLVPEGQFRLPPGFTEPAVRFEEGTVRLGGRYTDDHWEVILSVGLTAEVAEDGGTVKIALADVRGGSLPIARVVLDRVLEPVLRNARGGEGRNDASGSSLSEVKAVEDLFSGVSIRNRFIWPNGERRFRVDSVVVDHGVLRLRIEPLAR